MGKKKILIVDDEKTLAETLKLLLEDTGKYEAMIETRGRNTLAKTLGYKPDLILLDIIMPDISGDRVADELKNNEVTSGIPIIFLTAVVTEEEMDRESNVLGGYPFVAKPVNILKLLELIEKYIH